MTPNAIDSALAAALPTMSEGMTRSRLPAAKGIAPSVMNDRLSSYAARGVPWHGRPRDAAWAYGW